MAAGLTLAGCQTIDYRQVAPGPDKGTALAYCEMNKYAVQQPYYYVGSQTYVNMMALSAQMQNQSRMEEFVRLCMRAAGWEAYVVEPPKTR